MIFEVLTSFLLSQSNPVSIAVIDSGYFINSNNFKKCLDGDKDFTKSSMNDTVKHGQNVTHIIADGLREFNYCIISIKVFDEKLKPSFVMLPAFRNKQ